MARQSTSHPMFAQVPDEFFSPFPSNDSLMSGKYQALTRATSKLSEELATMQQAKAFNITLQILQKTRATKAGDLLTDWLPEIAWFKEHKVRLMIRKRQREGIETARKMSSTSFYRQARK